jgi:Flp pilus assembly protein TadB
MSSYKNGEDAATVVAVILLLGAAFWLWDGNTGTAANEENAVNKAREKPATMRIERQATALSGQSHQAGNGNLRLPSEAGIVFSTGVGGE